MKVEQIIRSKRKTFALVVKRDGSLVVRAPMNATDDQIETIVQKKETWIREKQALVLDYYPQTSAKEFVNGEGFLYLGHSYQLAIVEDQSEPLRMADRFYLARPALDRAPEVFTDWYRQRALEVLSARVAWYAGKHGFDYQRVKIMNARTRWGSCGPKGNLNFAWRLVMSPLKVVDYMVIHELVHLQDRNHSKAFWERIKTIMPDSPQQIAWLERYGHTLSLNGH